jgi:DNA replication and repair protein RecF
MILKRLQLAHYRSHEDFIWEPDALLNLISGPNGSGKTNLLDAVFQLAMAKSHLTHLEAEVIAQNAPFYRLVGLFVANEKDFKVTVKYQSGKRKIVEHFDEPCASLADHIGEIRLVLIAPFDVDLVREGSEERRRFMDNTLCQTDKQYLHYLMRYNKLLDQRNALLKQKDPDLSQQEQLLLVYDQQMEPAAHYIVRRRAELIERLNPFFNEAHTALAGIEGIASCAYQSSMLTRDLTALALENRRKDLILQRSSVGVHRDDMVFLLDGQPLKRIASQGQLKSFVIALKLAQFACLDQDKRPLLLLDDVFDRLDSSRVERLLDFLTKKQLGQIFITDTDAERVAVLAKRLGVTFGHVAF